MELPTRELWSANIDCNERALMSLITVRNLTHLYYSRWNRSRAIRALDHVSLELNERELLGLIGTNGAGKTTLVKCLLGMVRPAEGEITLLGGSPEDPRVKTRIGYLPEDCPYDQFLTGRTFLEFQGGMSGLGGAELRARIDELAGDLDLAADLDRSLKHYSKGMCQRLGLIQALLHRPRLLILDEPTDGLDPFGRIALRSMLGRLRDAGTSILLNSHLLSEVEMVCDRVAVLHEGRIVRSGRVKELTGDRALTAIRIGAADRTGLCGPPENIVIDEAGETCDILVHSPEEVNSMLDHLRRQGIRILEVQSRIASLEGAFLQIVGENEGKEMRA